MPAQRQTTNIHTNERKPLDPTIIKRKKKTTTTCLDPPNFSEEWSTSDTPSVSSHRRISNINELIPTRVAGSVCRAWLSRDFRRVSESEDGLETGRM